MVIVKNICEYLTDDLNYNARMLFLEGIRLLLEGNPKGNDYIQINWYIKL
jgi:hypothetical protein